MATVGHRDGLLSTVPSFNSVNRYLADPTLTPILKGMIETSALPLRAIETNFAVDSPGFATSRFVRWYAKQHEAVLDNHEWVKAHAMVGVATGGVTSVEISGWTAHDYPYLPQLVADTATRFNVAEVSADKGYVGRTNAAAIAAVGATPFMPFRARTMARKQDAGTAYEQMWHWFSLNRESFLEHYHQRSNVESTFGAIKAKFGSSVRAKTDAGQVNEVLCKILAHNLCVLIRAMLQLGIEA
jgi:transposase